MNGTINILAIKPGERPERLTIDNTLEAKQKLVGGYIEAFGLMAGTFVICGFNPDSGEDTSLTPQQAEYWMRRFHEPETFVQTMDGSIRAIPIR